MGFKIASLFVDIEAKTKRFTDQLAGLKRKTSLAGDDVSGTSFAPELGGEFEAALSGLPRKIAKAMDPVGSQIGSSLQAGLAPASKSASAIGSSFARVVGIVERVGKAILHFFRFEIALKALDLLKSKLESFSADFTGRSKKLASVFGAVINVAIWTVKIKQVQARLNLLLSPVRKLASVFGGVVTGLGRATAGTARLASGLTGANRAASGLKSVLGQVAMAAGFVAIGFKVVEFFHKAVTGASDFRETMDKVDAVLKDSAPTVVKFADEMASKFGLVKTVTLDAASGFAGLAKGIGGLKGQELSDFSVKFTKLSADFSSFANLDFDEAQKSIKIGLTGEPSDVLKQFGVIVNETLTEQYALSHGMQKVNGDLTQQQKLMARAGLITQQLADADNNLELTQDSTANRARKASGEFQNMATTVGTALLPIVNKALALFSEFTGFLSRAFESNKGTFEGFVASVTYGLEYVGALFRNWQSVVAVAGMSIYQTLANVGERFSILGQNIAIIASYIGRNFFGLIKDALAASMTLLMNYGKNWEAVGTAIKNVLMGGEWKVDWTPMLDGFKATVEKFPELLKPQLVDLSKEMADEWGKIEADVAKRTLKPKAGVTPKGVAVDQPDAVAESKEKKSGKITDLTAFAHSLQEAIGGKNKDAADTAKAGKQTVVELQKLNAAMKGGKGGGVAVGPGWQAAGLA